MTDERAGRRRDEPTVEDEVERQEVEPPERPELSSRIGATMPVVSWRLYQHTRAGKGNVGDVSALCDALRGVDEYLPPQFEGMVDEVERLLHEWNRVSSRLEKLERDRKLVAEFERLKSSGRRTGEALEEMAQAHGTPTTAEGMEKALSRARKRLAVPISRWRRD